MKSAILNVKFLKNSIFISLQIAGGSYVIHECLLLITGIFSIKNEGLRIFIDVMVKILGTHLVFSSYSIFQLTEIKSEDTYFKCLYYIYLKHNNEFIIIMNVSINFHPKSISFNHSFKFFGN